MLVRSATTLDGLNGRCVLLDCSLTVNASSTLATSSFLTISNGFKLILAKQSEARVESGWMTLTNGSLVTVDSSRLLVAGSAFVQNGSAVFAYNSTVTISGPLTCNGGANGTGLFFAESRFTVGGSVSLSNLAGIFLSSSIFSANLGNITTDGTSAIVLTNNSVLSGVGHLDAAVYTYNSSALVASILYPSPV